MTLPEARKILGLAADEPIYGFIDTVLDAGSYYIQIDGYNGDRGRWVLEVFTSVVTGE